MLARLRDPFAPVWFVAENPSLTQVGRAVDSTPEHQWDVGIGDKLFRQQLVEHGFTDRHRGQPWPFRHSALTCPPIEVGVQLQPAAPLRLTAGYHSHEGQAAPLEVRDRLRRLLDQTRKK